MKKITEILKKSYKTRVLFTVYACVFIPTIILCVVIAGFTISGYKNDLNTIEQDFIRMQRNEIENYMNEVSDKMTYLIAYDELSNVLAGNKNQTFEAAYANSKRLTSSLDAVFWSFSFKDSRLEIYTENENVYESKYIKKLTTEAKKQFENVTDENKIYTFFSDKDGERRFDMVRKYSFFDKNHYIIKISVNADKLFENPNYGKENFAVVCDTDNETVIPLGTSEKQKAKDAYARFEKGRHTDYRVIKTDDIFEKYVVYSFVNVKNLKERVFFTASLYICLLILASVCTSILVNRIVDKLTSRLTEIVDGIISGDPAFSNSELSEAYDEFDIIQFKLDDFKKKLIAENDKIIKLELHELGNKISPHFLYNILGAVKSNIDDWATKSTIEYLIGYYRKAFHQSSALISVKEETENIKLYMTLLQYAYGKDLMFNICADEIDSESLILSKVIQPLLENAFIHGINQCADIYGEIQVKIFISDANTVIEVWDNALAADFEKINAVLNDYESKNSALKIINKRLKLYCGEKYGLTYFEKNGFTVAHLEMPYNLTEETK